MREPDDRETYKQALISIRDATRYAGTHQILALEVGLLRSIAEEALAEGEQKKRARGAVIAYRAALVAEAQRIGSAGYTPDDARSNLTR